ncbi:hypothetical protein IFM61606_05391 [Aspergillus udagawae]|uniref:Uncharacterized protein n=1 Tax=Aspergillus udagawae TaxID=91492 RepID=A0ABQ1B9Y2_9EURO|nr:hypothetical protein IFM53868_08876 [Aspergillus udagawae]GFG09814.1 hypothetical protein IFM5058_04610 [Aspergillus udagawae]GFG25449.1 hypothetical protein IFM61606_05391 [Aspergillus udagawae]
MTRPHLQVNQPATNSTRPSRLWGKPPHPSVSVTTRSLLFTSICSPTSPPPAVLTAGPSPNTRLGTSVLSPTFTFKVGARGRCIPLARPPTTGNSYAPIRQIYNSTSKTISAAQGKMVMMPRKT